ncbi:oxygen-independent coproporphyrinogen III oxidase [Propionicicella superfundia]|uniref:oxygen-independent coproporphyrinogen III oxidase n=1 Tax=Propionicicella superfundia TaxID=348582 RepID=UPI0004027251|nr:oxygen-independent coproporphyrinogen III oxidase [Propionicicella superfundia]
MAVHAIEWDHDLIRRYDRPGPRYTSYPTAVEFTPDFTEQQFRVEANRYPDRPLSLYVHIPFCHKLCYFCSCNKVVTHRPERIEAYLDVLESEIVARAPLFTGRRATQIHWGGGTPTYLDEAQISRLMGLLRTHFDVDPGAEVSIEVDPREIGLGVLDHLRSVGFNRLSIGVQDFDPEVQRVVNREQDEAFIFALLAHAREVGFESTSIDLIYGLPKQTQQTFAHTLDRVVALGPDRLSVFNYGHMPALFPAQRILPVDALPTADQKLGLLRGAVETLTAAGYLFIGMDHFARPDDELAVAQREGVLHRNFQGYTTQGDADLLGLGVSAISTMGDSYAQNEKDLVAYSRRVVADGTALVRGVRLAEEDVLRRSIITELMCAFRIDIPAIERRWGVDFAAEFAPDLEELAPMAADGLVEITSRDIVVTPRGRLLVRNIAMCFDAYLRRRAGHHFSRAI